MGDRAGGSLGIQTNIEAGQRTKANIFCEITGTTKSAPAPYSTSATQHCTEGN